ncbi:NADH-quinone oxidoreductase subunit NuoN [Oceanicella actignis]|uniref:NADH-quinone oxidoreductase subunit NuoN n=1 Tax=Oceanicella actignis TaxID=1189325 RepID=UPI0011E68AA3|nr:NADH-quinone oxidoreductase subunit NuoN [Oceanicella actignis]TYO90068.1 NADH dehydrogenase subunit N [Oceanicella actignis]
MLSADLYVVLPEALLALFAMAALMACAFGGQDRWASGLTWLTAAFFALLGLIVSFRDGGQEAFGGAFVSDGFARFAKALILFSAAAVLALSENYLRRRRILKFEYPVLIAMATLGMMVMVSAGDLMSLYMGLELQSLSLYVVAAFRRDSVKSTEAGLKYFVLGALGSGLLLYGASLIYGYAGATRFAGIAEAVHEGGLSLGLLFGVAFLCAGLAFKISAVPFHMWTPDVYEGSPTAVTAFFATAPKVAAGALFARVLFDAFGEVSAEWRQILAFLAVASMFLGSIAAIVQTNIKRLMAYSSIAHMGFALMGLAAGTQQGVEALLVYLSIYVAMNVGAFAFIMCMERDGAPVTGIGDLAGLARTRPGQALAVSALMFSLAGVPPLLGFFGKWMVFVAAVDAGLAPLAVAGAVASVIGAFYYLRIVKIMYFDEPGLSLTGSMPFAHGLALTAAALVMSLGWAPGLSGFGVPELAATAAAALFN